MTETSYFWGGTTVGDAVLAPYSDDDWSDVWRKHFQADRTTQGVIPAYANELAVTNPAGNTIRVATGAALVDGKFYESDATVDFTVVTPGVGFNFYTIVLRKSWAAQTVRLDMLGPNAVAYPSVTQTDNAIWEVAIAHVSSPSGGAISIVDIRRFVPVTETMVIPRRQGGSATAWMSAGTTSYNPGAILTQVGSLAGSASADAQYTAVFPIPFQHEPLVLVSIYIATSGDADDKKLVATIDEINSAYIKVNVKTHDGGTPSALWSILWMAVGSG